MIDFNEINEALKTVQVNASDIREIKGVLNKKFHLYFESDEVKVLAKITTPALTVMLKRINSITLGKTGELTIDSFFSIQKDLQVNIIKLSDDESDSVLSLMEKLIVITTLKVDESEDMSFREKFDLFDLLIRNIEKIGLTQDVTLKEIFPHADKVLNGFRRKYQTVDVSLAKKKARKPMSNKMRSRLQKEINSSCPFCSDEGVEFFEGHHIDEDRSNTVFENMLLVCSTCHTKIGAGAISKEEVAAIKSGGGNPKVEIYKISIDPSLECWEVIPGVKNAFRLQWEKGNAFPIFQIHFINHFDKTIVLMDVELRVKHLYSGFGDLPQPCEVQKSNLYKILIKPDKEVHTPEKFQGIQIPSQQSMIFETEVANFWNNDYTNLDSRMILYFTLKFSNNILISVPRILINGEDEKDGVKIVMLS